MNTKIPLKHAPQPFEFFKTQFLNEGSARKNNSRSFWKSKLSPVRKSADNPNWFKELNKHDDKSRWEFIFRTMLNDNPELMKKIDSNIDTYPAKQTSLLKGIEGFKSGLEQSLSKHRCLSFLAFLLTQGDRELDTVEACYWMLFSYKEIAIRLSSFETEPSDINDPNRLMFPPQCWIPSMEDNGLISTRFQIVDHLLKNFTCKPSASEIKRLKRARTNGKVITRHIITKDTPIPDAIKPEGVYPAIVASLYPKGRPDSGTQNEIREFIYMILRFASYFDYIQIQQLNDGFSPENIVKSFERYHSIRNEFYNSLSLFYDKNTQELP